jgi:hypothetical protein
VEPDDAKRGDQAGSIEADEAVGGCGGGGGDGSGHAALALRLVAA